MYLGGVLGSIAMGISRSVACEQILRITIAKTSVGFRKMTEASHFGRICVCVC